VQEAFTAKGGANQAESDSPAADVAPVISPRDAGEGGAGAVRGSRIITAMIKKPMKGLLATLIGPSASLPSFLPRASRPDMMTPAPVAGTPPGPLPHQAYHDQNQPDLYPRGR
jgi:hypothetical protein